MLSEQDSFTLPEVPGVRVYPDHADHTRFYAVPEAPRVARDEQGRPALSLLVFGRGSGPNLKVLGGQVLLTLTLALTDAERQALTAALEQPLNRDLPRDAPPVRVTLLSPEWLEGQVTAHLLPGLDLTGQPSLMAANECVLSANLTGEQATELQRAWKHGLPDAQLTYDVTVPAAEVEEHRASTSHTSTEPPYAATSTSSFAARSTRTVSAALHLQGPLNLSQSDLQGGLQVTGF